LSPGRRAIAVPFVLDGRPVAVLYADEGSDGQPLASWLETVQILGRHATSVITSLTAVRTAQAMGFIARRSRGESQRVGSRRAATRRRTEDEMQSARRYARLLVSEIKLYNEGRFEWDASVATCARGSGTKSIVARRLTSSVSERAVPDRETYFHQELVQTLADGDPSLFE
jgi:hypothetical protein